MDDRLLTIAEAAKLTGVAKSTITRARTRGEFPRAQQKDRTWYIPLNDLIASGRIDTVRKTTPDADDSAPSTEHNSELEHALELAELRAVHAEQLLHQARELLHAKDETIDALHNNLKQLTRQSNPKSLQKEYTNTDFERIKTSTSTPRNRHGHQTIISRLFRLLTG